MLVVPVRYESSIEVVAEIPTFPETSDTSAREDVRLFDAMVVAAPVRAFCFPLNTFQSALERYPFVEVLACPIQNTPLELL